ncbi:MAG: DUF4115 domain-containing protein [Gammaproteobacteria bacterium]|nr:DUF4115 domain-containing protein [Gammaproteobacteria bacterium]
MNHNNSSGNDVENLIRQRQFGDRFRVAREAAGLSTAEVADELRLAEDIIKALENSQLDSLPAPTFTQGYIRSYAKMLKLSVDEILKAYDQLIPEKASPLTMRAALSAQKDSNHIAIKLISFGFLIAALVLLVFWFQQTDFTFINGENDNANVTATEIGQKQLELTEISDGPESRPTLQTSEQESESVIESENTHLATSVIQEEVVNSVIESAAPATEPFSTEEGSSMSAAELQSRFEDATISDAKLGQEAAKKKVLITQPIIGNDVLVMATDTESWAEVEDANGARLYFDLMTSGEDYKLRGQAPFKLFLGNAPSVTIGVNNQILNISNNIRRNNIAHIQISADGAISPIRRRITESASSNADNSSQNPEAAETTNNLQSAPEDE